MDRFVAVDIGAIPVFCLVEVLIVINSTAAVLQQRAVMSLWACTFFGHGIIHSFIVQHKFGCSDSFANSLMIPVSWIVPIDFLLTFQDTCLFSLNTSEGWVSRPKHSENTNTFLKS